MSAPLRDSNRDKTATSVIIPSPTGGWNKIDSYASMPVTDAIVMDNWIPRESFVELREGFKLVIETLPANTVIETLMNYNVSGRESLLMAAGGHINVVDLDMGKFSPLRNPKSNAFDNNIWNYTLYKQTLIMANGVDAPQFYVGTLWNANKPNVTGVMPIRFKTSTAEIFDGKVLDNVAVYNKRLFFTEKNSLNFWYASVAGSVPVVSQNVDENGILNIKSFELEQFANKGGSIAAMSNWTKTGAEGLSNLLIIVTDAGETFVYQGTDPASADSWELLGIYQIPRILGQRSLEKVGSDLVILTEEGYFSIAGLLNADYVSNNTAISNKIDGAIKEISKYKFDYWQIKYIAQENLLLVNVARYRNIKDVTNQHVLNVSNGAWCRFTDINATCFETFKGETYFGGTHGHLYRLFDGTTDDNKAIKSHVQQAYSNFESPRLKSFKMAKFIVSAALETVLETNLIVDFMASNSQYKSSLPNVQSMWDVAMWDVSMWSSENVVRITSVALSALPGYYASLDLTTNSQAQDVAWYSTLVVLTVEK